MTRRHHPGIWTLAVTAFAIGVAEFIVVGVLPAIAADLNVPGQRCRSASLRQRGIGVSADEATSLGGA